MPVSGTLAISRRVVPLPNGGYWMSGLALPGSLRTTPNAFQPQAVAAPSYARSENFQTLTPPGSSGLTGVLGIAVDPENDNRIYALASRGVAVSEDNGWTWTSLTPPAENLIGIAAGRGHLWLLAAQPQGMRLLVSRDRGATWRDAILINQFRGQMAAHPTLPGTFYLGAGDSLLVTRDGGDTWATRSFTSGFISALAVDDRAVAVATTPPPGRFISPVTTLHWSDDGNDFSRSAPLQGSPPLRFDPNEPGRLYLMNGPGVIRTDASLRFETVTPAPGPGQPPIPFIQFGFQPGLPGAIWALTPDGRVGRSGDGGRTFSFPEPPQTGPITSPPPFLMAVGGGGVLHLVYPTGLNPTGFAGKVSATGEVEYLTYLGGRSPTSILGATRLSNGLVAVVGTTDGAGFPGEPLGASGAIVGGPPMFAVAFDETGGVAYSVTLNLGLQNPAWIGPGPGSTLFLVGAAFPTVAPGPIFTPPVPSLIFGRLRP